jgi:predicted DsbA family dithiol-disulfide isomerase
VNIEIFSDPICPWCFIGKRRLERALALAGGDGVDLVGRAFQLNPTMPAGGMDRRAYLETKFGGGERARQVYEAIRREGVAEGIAFQFGKIARTPNTVTAHRLLRRARTEGGESELAERLFTAYFLEGDDIGDPARLAVLWDETHGADPGIVQWLTGDAERDAVLAEDEAARRSGITGVPHFVIDGQFAIPGAQPPEVIARAIELARAAADGG